MNYVLIRDILKKWSYSYLQKIEYKDEIAFEITLLEKIYSELIATLIFQNRALARNIFKKDLYLRFISFRIYRPGTANQNLSEFIE